MAKKRLLDHDAFTGITTWFEDCPDGKDITLHYEQDVEPILELNKAKQSEGRNYYAKDDELWRVASIPIMVQFKWLNEHGVDVLNEEHWPKVRQLLNDPDYRYLKTAEIII